VEGRGCDDPQLMLWGLGQHQTQPSSQSKQPYGQESTKHFTVAITLSSAALHFGLSAFVFLI